MNFILEIGTEEMPAAAVYQGLEQLRDKAAAAFVDYRLTAAEIKTYATPRRLILSVIDLADKQRETVEKVKGPPRKVAYDEKGQPTAAAVGFARSQQVGLDELVVEEEGGAYVFAVKRRRGEAAVKVLPRLLPELILSLRFPKTMRWGTGDIQFVRPIRWLTAFYGDKQISFTLELRPKSTDGRSKLRKRPKAQDVQHSTSASSFLLSAGQTNAEVRERTCKYVTEARRRITPQIGFSAALLDGLKSDGYTYGHRFIKQPKIKVENADALLPALTAARVLWDQDDRRRLIEKQIKEAAAAAGGEAEINPAVLSEVVNLVEYPQALVGGFSAAFLSIPKVVIKSALEAHQRYFMVTNDNRVLPVFVVVQNGDPAFAAQIIKGHERVLRARLADAAFFFREDTREPLAAKVEKLRDVVYQKKIGSVYDKVRRDGELCRRLSRRLGLSKREDADLQRAAELCKADLVTEMVGEFPDLQGLIGGEYALVDKESPVVAAAIAEHYRPRFAGDKLPTGKLGALLAVADKVDAVVGCFNVGLIPSGSKDPYALRRQGQGAVDIIGATWPELDIFAVVAEAVDIYREAGLPADRQTREQLRGFWRQRLITNLKRSFSEEFIEAVLAAGDAAYVDIISRLRILQKFSDDSRLTDAVIAFTRCANLADSKLGLEVAPDLLQQPAEVELWRQAQNAAERLKAGGGDAGKNFLVLAGLRPAVDDFFEKVMVMDKDIKLRQNRLRLLNYCRRLSLKFADFAKLS